MPSIVVAFRAQLVWPWSSWLALVLLVALIGEMVLAGASTAADVIGVFKYYEPYGYDVAVFSSTGFTKRYFNLPYPTKITKDPYYGNGSGSCNSNSDRSGNGTTRGQFIPKQVLGPPLAISGNCPMIALGALPHVRTPNSPCWVLSVRVIYMVVVDAVLQRRRSKG